MYYEPEKVDFDAINAKADADFACNHVRLEARKQLASNGAISIWKQCIKCGTKIKPAILKRSMTAAQLDALPSWDKELETRFFATKRKTIEDMVKREQEKLDATRRRRYDNYLDGPDWKEKREAVIARANGICEGCGKGKATEAHHLTYDDFGDEFLFQLVALCENCHVRWHARRAAEARDPNTPDSPF